MMNGGAGEVADCNWETEKAGKHHPWGGEFKTRLCSSKFDIIRESGPCALCLLTGLVAQSELVRLEIRWY